MERKTMGSFLAALRRTKGLTQKELAELLNVSDKSVSRWERDEGVPDLSLIPVIAEIFGVTSDELLRGERRPPEEREGNDRAVTAKAEKQRRRLLASGLTRYRSQSLISMALALCGLIAAMIGNFAFGRADIGFYAGLICLLFAAVLQGIWVNGAMLTVSDEEFAGEEKAGAFRCRVILLAEKIWTLVLTLLAAILPLALADLLFRNHYGPGASIHVNVQALSFWSGTVMAGGVGLLLCCLILRLLNRWLTAKGVLTTGITCLDRSLSQKNRKFRRRCTAALLAVMAVTFLGETLLTHGWSAARMAEKLEFDNYPDFVDFMQQESFDYINVLPGGGSGLPEIKGNKAVHPENPPEYYYTKDGTAVSAGVNNPWWQELRSPEGETLCVYMWQNHSVTNLRYGSAENGYLPIRAVTRDRLTEASRRGGRIVAVFAALYVLEAAAVGGVYLLRREKESGPKQG